MPMRRPGKDAVDDSTTTSKGEPQLNADIVFVAELRGIVLVFVKFYLYRA
jgi:hypothetical protein